MKGNVKALVALTAEELAEFQKRLDKDTGSSIAGGCRIMSYYDAEDKNDRGKILTVTEVIRDMLKNEPSDEELDYDDDKIKLYEDLHNLKEDLENLGMM